MADRSDSVKGLAPYGWVTAIAGAADLVRLVPEAVGVRNGNSLYTLLVCGDLAAGVFAAVAGVALVRGRRWAPAAAAPAWGYFLGNSTGMIWSIGWFFLSRRGELPGLEDREFRILMPRILFYALSALIAPFIVGMVIMRGAAPGERKEHFLSLVVGLIVGAATAGLFIYLRHLK